MEVELQMTPTELAQAILDYPVTFSMDVPIESNEALKEICRAEIRSASGIDEAFVRGQRTRRVGGMGFEVTWFGRLYLLGWIILIVTEIVAATTSWVTTDTMSELYWTAQERFPVMMRIILTVGLAVLWWHLVNKGTVK